MLKLLKDEKLSGIALDVFEYEKELASILRDGEKISELPDEIRDSVSASLELMDCENVLLTPHNAFNTEESVSRKAQQTAENLEAFYKKFRIYNANSTIKIIFPTMQSRREGIFHASKLVFLQFKACLTSIRTLFL